jgi:hypothetical protein
MQNLLEYIFSETLPWTWLVADIVALALTLVLLFTIIKREKHPIPRILEVFAFVFLYASIYENAAIVMGLYDYGRTFTMIGSVPAFVPLIEAFVLVTGFWLLDKTALPNWTKPPIIGLFGMLQDFSLDPLSIRQVYDLGERVSGRWNWLIQPTDPNILNIPVFNFPGWMLIMLYSATCLLLGRWWYRKSGYKRIVGYIYLFITMILSLLLMISPVSNFLLWLEPIFDKGSYSEWIMLGFHLVFPTILLIFLWRGSMTAKFTREDLPIFLIPSVLHLYDIVFSLVGGFTEILWLVILASVVHTALLALFLIQGQKVPIAAEI